MLRYVLLHFGIYLLVTWLAPEHGYDFSGASEATLKNEQTVHTKPPKSTIYLRGPFLLTWFNLSLSMDK